MPPNRKAFLTMIAIAIGAIIALIGAIKNGVGVKWITKNLKKCL